MRSSFSKINISLCMFKTVPIYYRIICDFYDEWGSSESYNIFSLALFHIFRFCSTCTSVACIYKGGTRKLWVSCCSVGDTTMWAMLLFLLVRVKVHWCKTSRTNWIGELGEYRIKLFLNAVRCSLILSIVSQTFPSLS